MKIKFDIMIKLPNGSFEASHTGNIYELDSEDLFDTIDEATKWAKEQVLITDHIDNIELLEYPDSLELIEDTMKHTAENFDGEDYSTEEGLMNLNESLHSDDYYFEVKVNGQTRYVVSDY